MAASEPSQPLIEIRGLRNQLGRGAYSRGVRIIH